MNHYLLYLDNDLNRVFGGSLVPAAVFELKVVADAIFPGQVEIVEARAYGRAQVIEISSTVSEPELVAMMGQLASTMALFRVGSENTLHPVIVEDGQRYGPELVGMQGYRGKTNERLTRMMLNVGLATAGLAPWDSIGVVLDPMCGRGTTLHCALAYGLDAVGIELDRSSLDHQANFMRSWAKKQRLPHEAMAYKEKNKEKRHTSISVALNREDLKAGVGQLVSTFCADGADQTIPLKPKTVDVIVVDLPYGTLQGKSPVKGAGKYSRGGPKPSPSSEPDWLETVALLERMIPAWVRWLRPGGAICLAWNLKRAKRKAVIEVLQANGFRSIEPDEGDAIAHRVDSTIIRDIIVAELLPENLRD